MFEYGNISELNASHPETRMWFLGSFIDEKSIFHNTDFEAKWSERKAGEFYTGSQSVESRKTITIMIDGEGEMQFPSHDTVVPLAGKGSYVTFDTSSCTHNFYAKTDCTILTLRYT